jgi:hypothetical protein
MGWGRTNNDEDDRGNTTVSGAFSSILQVPMLWLQKYFRQKYW